jgi:signal transduction histidine kinase
MLRLLRSRLVWKVFLSYTLVVLVGLVVLATATSLSFPAAFDRHLAGMSAMMAGQNVLGDDQAMEQELFDSYSASVNEALSFAAVAALIAALIASFFISRQVVNPVQRMMKLSHKIAEGEYQARLDISPKANFDQMDELNQLALSFNQMAERLEKTEIMRRQLIGDVSHELRTPLTAIKGYMEGLIDGVLPANPDIYQKVNTEIDRLQRLVNDLQELSRVEGGEFQLRPAYISPATLIETLSGNLGRQFEEKGIQLEINISPNLPEILVDKDRILQVLTNLAGNALQYTPRGGKVTIRGIREKSEVIISMSDTGIGISPEQLPLVFNRFYRTDKSRARASGGSGIGLTIAQALVRAHHGRIWVESGGEGKGSTFSFALPIPPESKL